MITKCASSFLFALLASHIVANSGLRCYDCSDNNRGNCQATDANKQNGYIRGVDCGSNGSCAVVSSYVGVDRRMMVRKLACYRPCNETSSCGGDTLCVTCCESDYCNIGDQQGKDAGQTDGDFHCQKGLFKCHTQELCLDQSSICDGSFDCDDHSDETNCPTDSTQVTAVNDTGDNYVCPSITMFLCKSDMVCISGASRCDGQSDCSDSSDETNCKSNCTQGDFKCSGVCVPAWKVRCNSIVQCTGGKDEFGCSAPCASDLFQCGDATCILGNKKCDGYPQCGDYSDETNCTSSCKKGEFLCDNGHCVDQMVVCDGGNNCWDRSDERNCSPCFDGSFRCWDPVHSDNCYLDTERCDGHFHCKQGADEKGCGACDPDQFACEITQADASHCYDSSQLCDGRIDCNKNQADESNPLCQSNYQKCPTGLYSCLLKDSEGTQCYDAVRRCDGIADCRPSASDETGCSHKCDHFCKDTFQCWNETNRCDGKYFCPDFSDEEGCGLCLFDQFLCRNSNKCFHRSDMCNGIKDCWDGFDEMYCSKDTCGGIDQLYPAAERCNGRVFCTSGEDEKGCGPCRPDQFTCGGSELTTLCYDQHQRCNEHADCPSPSVDEMNCVFSSDSHVVGSDHPRTGPTAINLPQKAFSSKAIIAIVSMSLAVTVICTLIAGLCHKRRRRRRRQQYTTERSSVSTNDLLPPPYSETDVGSVYFNNRLQIQDRLTFIGFPSSENDDDLPSYEESLLLADTNTMINGTHDGQAVNEAQDDYSLPSEQEIDHTNDEEGNPADRLL